MIQMIQMQETWVLCKMIQMQKTWVLYKDLSNWQVYIFISTVLLSCIANCKSLNFTLSVTYIMDEVLLQVMNLKALRILRSMSRAWGVVGWSAWTTASCIASWTLRSSCQSFLRRISLMKNNWRRLSLTAQGLQRMFLSSEHYCGMIVHPMDCWSSVTPWKQHLDRST